MGCILVSTSAERSLARRSAFDEGHFGDSRPWRGACWRPSCPPGPKLPSICSRMHGLAALAKALKQGDHALAAIVLAQSQFPAFPDKGAGARINNAATMIDDRLFTHRLPLALLLALLSGVPARARNVECPAVWTGDSSKSKVKDAAVYTNDTDRAALGRGATRASRTSSMANLSICNVSMPIGRYWSSPCTAKTRRVGRSAAAEFRAREQCSEIRHEYCSAAYSNRSGPWR